MPSGLSTAKHAMLSAHDEEGFLLAKTEVVPVPPVVPERMPERAAERVLLPEMTVEGAREAIRGSTLPRKRGIQPFGRVEIAILAVLKERGTARPFELHVENGGDFKNPGRVLERLCKRGVLERVEKGAYAIARPQRDRLAEIRASARVIRQGAHFVAPNGLTIVEGAGFAPRGKILKGNRLTYAERAAVPGDIVLVTVKGLRKLRRFVGFEAVRMAEKAQGIVVAHDTGTERIALSEEVLLYPVNGFHRRFTTSAAEARADASDASGAGAGVSGVSGSGVAGVANAAAVATLQENAASAAKE